MQTLSRRVITESCTNMRRLGRERLKGNWNIMVIGILLAAVCVYVPNWILNNLLGKTETITEVFTKSGIDLSKYSSLFTSDQLQQFSNTTMHISPVSNIYLLLVVGTFSFGIIYMMMLLFRARQTRPSDVFVGFGMYVKTLGLYLYMALFMMLWSLIPVAGIFLAIIAAFRYSQSFYILFDNPDMPVPAIVAASKYMMMGNKGKLFCLDLSFIGWALLAVVPSMITSGIASYCTSSVAIIGLASFVGSAAELWVMAYMTAAQTAFYEILIGNIKAETYIPGVY